MITRIICLATALSFPAVGVFAQEREWSWDVTDTDAFLVFGTPNTDDVGVSFWCKLGSKQIKVLVPGLKGKFSKKQNAVAVVSVGGLHKQIKGVISPNIDSGTHEFEGLLSSSDPLFGNLRVAPYFHVEVASRKSSFPLESANTADLVKVCTFAH